MGPDKDFCFGGHSRYAQQGVDMIDRKQFK